MTAPDWEGLARAVMGTASLPSEATLEHHGFDPNIEVDELEEGLAEQGIETCPGCGWWVEISDMDEEGYCGDCQDNE